MYLSPVLKKHLVDIKKSLRGKPVRSIFIFRKRAGKIKENKTDAFFL